MIELKRKITIAIDGFSSCGKSSFAKLIARKLGYIYIDSGAMYRSVALFAIRNNLFVNGQVNTELLIPRLPEIHISFKNSDSGIITLLNDENIEMYIRGAEVSSVVSKVSKIKEVRHHLVELQKKMGREKGIVMDGRDIGTVVFPDAEVKIYMKADATVRAKRRYDELVEKGIPSSLESIIKNIEERDLQDITREVSPLRQADDAMVLDNSYMTFDQQMEWFMNILKSKDLLK
jgi:cytidylate kinase